MPLASKTHGSQSIKKGEVQQELRTSLPYLPLASAASPGASTSSRSSTLTLAGNPTDVVLNRARSTRHNQNAALAKHCVMCGSTLAAQAKHCVTCGSTLDR